MRRWLAILATWVAMALAAAYFLARTVLDLIGYSTSPEDAESFPVLNWLQAQPWLVAYGVPAVLIAFGALTLYGSPASASAPNFSAVFNKERGCLTHEIERSQQNILTGTESARNSAYLRVLIVNKTDLPIHCRAEMTGISFRAIGETEFVPIKMPHEVALNGGQRFEVPPRGSRMADFLRVGVDNKPVPPALTVIWPNQMENSFHPLGDYRVSFRVDAGHAPKRLTIEVNWNGEWETIDARQVNRA